MSADTQLLARSTSALKTHNNATAPPPLISSSALNVSTSICARRSTPLLNSFTGPSKCQLPVEVDLVKRAFESRAWRSDVLRKRSSCSSLPNSERNQSTQPFYVVEVPPSSGIASLIVAGLTGPPEYALVS